MVNINVNEYENELVCTYKGETYSVRDNGAIMRHPKEGVRKRILDNVWTFGKQDKNRGYMFHASESVHRIVAYAFLGNPPRENYVVDHIDTNRANNRPENLRWVTKLQNALNNEITRARIISICGSIESFLKDPSQLYAYADVDKNFSWMRAVTPEESQNLMRNIKEWQKTGHKSAISGGIGDWIFDKRYLEQPKINENIVKIEEEPNVHRAKFSDVIDSYSKKLEEVSRREEQKRLEFERELERERLEKEKRKEEQRTKDSLTKNAKQRDWKVPTEFPCCPAIVEENPIEQYYNNLEKGKLFAKNSYGNVSIVEDFAKYEDSILVICKLKDNPMKNYALSKIIFENGCFVHISERTFFEEIGARKYFTLGQGKEWTGGDCVDDYC